LYTISFSDYKLFSFEKNLLDNIFNCVNKNSIVTIVYKSKLECSNGNLVIMVFDNKTHISSFVINLGSFENLSSLDSFSTFILFTFADILECENKHKNLTYNIISGKNLDLEKIIFTKTKNKNLFLINYLNSITYSIYNKLKNKNQLDNVNYTDVNSLTFTDYPKFKSIYFQRTYQIAKSLKDGGIIYYLK
jgi:hypothetical protein